jgi:hypothetical protein
MSSPALQSLFPETTAVKRAATPGSNGRPPGVAPRPDDPVVVRLARMSTRQRIEASRSGGFSRHERAVWACRYPEEVPTVNGEFEWLVLRSADLE